MVYSYKVPLKEGIKKMNKETKYKTKVVNLIHSLPANNDRKNLTEKILNLKSDPQKTT